MAYKGESSLSEASESPKNVIEEDVEEVEEVDNNEDFDGTRVDDFDGDGDGDKATNANVVSA